MKKTQFKKIKLTDLKAADYNPRSMDDNALAGLNASIEEFGCVEPIIWNEKTGNVVGGHQRLKVLRSKKVKETDVVVVNLSLEKEKALNVALNNQHIQGDWTEGLELILDEIKGDLSGLYTDIKLDLLVNDIPLITSPVAPGKTDPDRAPEAPTEPFVKTNDLITLGKHKILCGDSTMKENVNKLMAGERVDMVFTDPPYGKNIVKCKKIGGGGKLKFGKTTGGNWVDSKTYKEMQGDHTTQKAMEFFHICHNLLKIKSLIIWGGNYFTKFLPPSPCWLIWDKQNTGNFADVEIAWTSFDKGAKLYPWLWNGLLRKGDRKSELISRVHPTQKPVGLFVEIFKDFLFDSCLDGFLGAGSTLIACESTNRTCWGIEIDPGYVQVSAQRWIDFTGRPEEVIVERAGKKHGWEEIQSL